jgi:hypothetical protein
MRDGWPARAGGRVPRPVVPVGDPTGVLPRFAPGFHADPRSVLADDEPKQVSNPLGDSRGLRQRARLNGAYGEKPCQVKCW